MVGFVPSVTKALLPYGDDYSKEEMKQYLNRLEKYNLYDYKVKVNENDNLVVLATCTRFYGTDDEIEFQVVGRMVRGGEDTKLYSVKKTEKYEEVEKKLKGDDDNEEV